MSLRNIPSPPTPLSGRTRILFVDVMEGGRFLFTHRFRWCPLFKVSPDEIVRDVLRQRPSLKNRKIELYIDHTQLQ